MLKLENFAVVVFAAYLVNLSVGALAQVAQPPSDEAQVAAVLARDFVQAIAEEFPPQCRVAVFPFGDTRGRVSPELSGSVDIIRGELIQQLTKLVSGRMYVLDRDGLAREFRRAGIDASGVSVENP